MGSSMEIPQKVKDRPVIGYSDIGCVLKAIEKWGYRR
jgi:hypothetical protein